MSQLSRHIEYLLLEHDHVAVPGFGTFVCKAQSMHHDDSGMFYVPRRDLSFIPSLTDDGVLASHVSQQEHCTLSGSRRLIAGWVEECECDVRDYGVADLGNLGQMVMEDGRMTFQPCKAGLSLSEYYGLDNFEMPILPLLATQIKEAVERAGDTGAKSKHIVIRLNRTLVNYVASIAASIVLFFAFTTPTAQTSVSEASFAPSFFVATTVADNVQDEEEEVVQAETDVVQKAEGFAVVVASSIKRSNAEAMVERLHNRGIEGASVYERGNMVRVAFLGFYTREAASEAAALLRTQDKELSGAWVLEIK